METAFILVTILLALYSLLAVIDGVYLHLYRYRLQERAESKLEHLTHTIRAFLFSGILITLFIQMDDNRFFYLGMVMVLLDILVLLVDAYTEKDSRAFMGGLPRWEYMLHLMVNGFHFAAIAVFLVLKINITSDGFVLNQQFEGIQSYAVFQLVAVNLLPGAVLISLLHVLVYSSKVNSFIKNIRLNCC